MNASPAATVVIVTKNRKTEVQRAIESALRQTAKTEVIVIDDGSHDGTESLVPMEFPSVRYIRDPQSKGYIVQRNRGARLAMAPIIVSLDDDAEFTSTETVSQAMQHFSDQRIGAVAILWEEYVAGQHRRSDGPSRDEVFACATFTGTAYAVRRDIFLELGGFREELVHFAEEGDLCIRLLDRGYYTVFGHAEALRHHPSSTRVHSHAYIFRARNSILLAWLNTPMPSVLVYLPGVTARWVMKLLTGPHRAWIIKGIWEGLKGVIKLRAHRAPVSKTTWDLSRTLTRRGAVPLRECSMRNH